MATQRHIEASRCGRIDSIAQRARFCQFSAHFLGQDLIADLGKLQTQLLEAVVAKGPCDNGVTSIVTPCDEP